MSGPCVLFVVSEVAHYGEFKKILLEPKINSKIEATILFDRDGYDASSLLSKEIANAHDCNFKFLVTRPIITTLPQNIFFKLLSRRLPGLSHFLNDLYFYKKKLNYLRNLLHIHHIDTVILGEENVLLNTFLFKKAAGSKKVLVYPYTIPNPKEMAGGAYQSAPSNTPQGRFLKHWGGRWTRQFDEKIFLLLPFSKIAALYFMKYRPINPWVLNSDTADRVCVESEKMANLYKKLGVAPSHISTIGSLNDDILARIALQKTERTDHLRKKYNLPADKPFILVGFPPNQFPRAAAEFFSYDELIQALIKTLTPYLATFSILISKHPRQVVPLDQMAQSGFVICDEPTIELIPLAHIYIASASATIRWAITAGIPVINYDLYRYHYGDYENSPAVKNVVSTSEFKAELNRILMDDDYYVELKTQQSLESKHWGCVDGHAADRLLDLITTKIF